MIGAFMLAMLLLAVLFLSMEVGYVNCVEWLSLRLKLHANEMRRHQDRHGSSISKEWMR